MPEQVIECWHKVEHIAEQIEKQNLYKRPASRADSASFYRYAWVTKWRFEKLLEDNVGS